jgi:hypothetical protein
LEMAGPAASTSRGLLGEGAESPAVRPLTIRASVPPVAAA